MLSKHLPGFCILILSISIFSADVTTPGGNPLFSRMHPLLKLSTPRSGLLAKQSAAIKDTLLVTRVDEAYWENETWEPTKYSLIAYDESGFATTVNEYSMDDSLVGQTVTTFLPDGKTVRTLTINSLYSLIYGNDTMISFSSYYPSYISTPFVASIYGNSGTMLNAYSAEFEILLYLDSTTTTMLLPDSETQSYDTMTISRIRYQKTGDNTYSSLVYMNMSYLTTSIVEYRLDYTFLHSPLSDTVKVEMTIISADPPELAEELKFMDNMMMIENRDQYGRVVELLMLLDSSGLSDNRLLATYSTDGVLESVITQEKDTLTGDWVNFQKETYTYSTISLEALPRGTKIRQNIPVTARRKNGTVFLSASADSRIQEVTVFNMQGRSIRRLTGTAKTVTIPVNTTGSGFSLLRVATNRGVYTLKCADID